MGRAMSYRFPQFAKEDASEEGVDIDLKLRRRKTGSHFLAGCFLCVSIEVGHCSCSLFLAPSWYFGLIGSLSSTTVPISWGCRKIWEATICKIVTCCIQRKGFPWKLFKYCHRLVSWKGNWTQKMSSALCHIRPMSSSLKAGVRLDGMSTYLSSSAAAFSVVLTVRYSLASRFPVTLIRPVLLSSGQS